VTQQVFLTGGGKRWVVRPPAPPSFVHELGMPALWASLLFNRGVRSPAEARSFLAAPRPGDPFALDGMDAAASRVLRAVEGRERITVYGDFDADGVTASALLFTALSRMGGNVSAYLPNRVSEGHGLNVAALRQLRAEGASLVITVDTGITASHEVEAANALGIDTVITDHHLALAPAPPAVAVVTPPDAAGASPLRFLAGAGLAFKLAHALYLARGEPLPDDLVGLAAVGTVADLTPLQGENRVLVTAGLAALQRTPSPGILALCETARQRPDRLDTEALSFGLVPRLNAAGRLGSPETSLRLLTASSLEEALPYAQTLEHLNRERQVITDELSADALPVAQLQAKDSHLLFIAGAQFMPGINGLVASRMVDRFQRPAVVAAVADGVARASARSVPGFNLAEALRSVSGHLVRHGGHAAAAGFVAREAELRRVSEMLAALAGAVLGGRDLTPSLVVDAVAAPRTLLDDTLRFLERLGPFGQGNPTPLFLARAMHVVEARRVGAEGRHLSLTLRGEGAVWDAVWFSSRGQDAVGSGLATGAAVDIVYSMSRDTRFPEGRPRLVVEDLRATQRGA